MKRLISILLFTLMIPSLVFGGTEPLLQPAPAPAALTASLPAPSIEKEKPFLMAHITEADRAALRESEPRKGHSWDNFWDVHFGGYRWAWWALAGGVLIAIHATAD